MKKITDFIKERKIVLIIAIVLIAILGFRIKTNAETNEEVVVAFPSIQNITKTLELTGYIDAKEKANLKFLAPSRLSWVGVKEGDKVKKWQAIASVDTRTLQKQLQADLNNFAKEFNDHDQSLDDYDYYGESGIASENRRILENAQYDLSNTVIAVEIRDLAVRLSSIISPINGIVTRVDQPNAGVNISVTDVFQIVNPDSMFFSAEVDELDVSRVAVDQKATLVLDAYEEEAVDSMIEFISFTPVSSPTGGTSYRVELSLPGSNDLLKYRLGMSGEVEIILDQKDSVLTIPSEAIIERDGISFVEIKNGEGTIEKKEVEIGIETDDLVEIVSGISQSDQVIIPN